MSKDRELTRRQVLQRAAWAGLGVVSSGSLLAACAREPENAGGGATGGATEGATASPDGDVEQVTLALLAPLTGAAATWGPLQAEGFRKAVDALNAEGGIASLGGARLNLEVVDTETTPEVAASQAERLSQDENVVAISGCNQSAASVIVSGVAHRNQLPFVTGTDADPQITEQGSEFSFRIPGTTEVYPRDMLAFAKAMQESTGVSLNRVAFLSSDSLLGQTANDFAEQHATEMGFEIVDLATYDTANVRDFTPFISRYQAAGIELFLGTHDPEPGVQIIRAMKQADWQPNMVGGMFGTFGTSDWIESVGSDGDAVYNAFGWNFNSSGLGMEEFVEGYREEYGSSPSSSFDPPGYSVVAVLAAALEATGSTDRTVIRDSIRQTRLSPGERRLFQMDGVDFDDTGANTRAATFVAMVNEGDTYVAHPEEYATIDPVVPRPSWQDL